LIERHFKRLEKRRLAIADSWSSTGVREDLSDGASPAGRSPGRWVELHVEILRSPELELLKSQQIDREIRDLKDDRD
jgi:hypothetical protein